MYPIVFLWCAPPQDLTSVVFSGYVGRGGVPNDMLEGGVAG
jgi:hypothetical protein